MTAGVAGAELVHSHTWYANLAGHLAKLTYDIPHVATVHSLEPLRPWKAEQLGGGYALSSWCERVALESADAVIAVSEGMRRDVLEAYPALDPERVRVIYNGIDAEQYAPDPGDRRARALGRRRRTRRRSCSSGGSRARRACRTSSRRRCRSTRRRRSCCARARPTRPRSPSEVRAGVERLRAERGGVIWIEEMLPKADVIQLLSHATVFACPSIYEPLGIVNLEAMACETAVVASAVGGIVEVVDDGVTGLLVPLDIASGSLEPRDRAGFVDRAGGRDQRAGPRPRPRGRDGPRGRGRGAVEQFAWPAIAEQTSALYRSLRMTAGRRSAGCR